VISTKNSLKNYLIGDKDFYKKVIMIIVPIIVQTTITNIVNLMDNVMVGRVGTLEMSAVAIANQLIFVFNLCIFGGLSGAGIFGTQYAGAKDAEGVRNCFRTKLYIATCILVIAISVFLSIPDVLINLYVSDSSSAADAASTLHHGTNYIRIMVLGLIPFAITQIYSSSLRETGETKIPMYASVMAIVLNTIFNLLLIFGMCGFPRLGVAGAAIATVISRTAEMLWVVFCAHRHKDKFKFLKGAFKNLHIPKELLVKILKKGSPVLVNELLWSLGVAMYLQCYSVRGLEVVAAANIASTVTNLFNVFFISTGNAVAIMSGQHLGANEVEKAKQTVWRLIFLSFTVCIIIGGILALLSSAIPNIYNTEPEVKNLAQNFLLVTAALMPIVSFTHNSYFAIRSGGKTIVTFIFDSGFMWLIAVPVAFLLSNYSSLDIITLYIIVNGVEIIKAFIAFALIKKGVWISNIVR